MGACGKVYASKVWGCSALSIRFLGLGEFRGVQA